MKKYEISAIATTLLAVTLTANASDNTTGNTLTRDVEHMASDTTPAKPIDGTTATLMTTNDGATMTMATAELPPGHVTTAWWVLITKPEACEAKPCSAEDVIGRADKVGTQIVYADGAVNSDKGTASFTGFLPKGEVQGGWYPVRFDNPTDAEIHLVLNDHGPLIPDLASPMLTSYRGGCSDESLPPPFPDTAKADGPVGPNTCMLVQDAIFVQRQ
jgi:hypothetical protein